MSKVHFFTSQQKNITHVIQVIVAVFFKSGQIINKSGQIEYCTTFDTRYLYLEKQNLVEISYKETSSGCLSVTSTPVL